MEVTATLEEYDLRSRLAWPNVSAHAAQLWRWFQDVQSEPLEINLTIPDINLTIPGMEALPLASMAPLAPPPPPRLSGYMLAVALVLVVLRGLVVGCHRRRLLHKYAHAKRL